MEVYPILLKSFIAVDVKLITCHSDINSCELSDNLRRQTDLVNMFLFLSVLYCLAYLLMMIAESMLKRPVLRIIGVLFFLVELFSSSFYCIPKNYCDFRSVRI